MAAGDTLLFWGLTLLTLPGVLGGEWAVNYSRNTLCAIRRSTVVIPCAYDYPGSFKVETVMWCRDDEYCDKKQYVYHSSNTDISTEYKDRADYLGNKEKNCTLQIKNITDADAGVYRFRFITNGTGGKWSGISGTTLKLLELKVVMTPHKESNGITEGDSVNLTCGSDSCSLSQSEFTWFKDNQPLPDTQSTLRFTPACKYHSANFSCGLKGNTHTVSKEVNLSVKDVAWAVHYSEKNLCAVRGSTVVIQCEYEYPEAYKVGSRMWSHNDVDCTGKPYVCHSNNTNISAEYTGRAEFLGTDMKNCTLQIKNIRKADAGEYRFRFTANGCEKCGGPGVTLRVDQLKVVITSSRGNETIRKGDSVNLTCGSDSCFLNQSGFTWFKDNQMLQETQSTLCFSPVSYNDLGKYSCALKGYNEIVSDVISLDFKSELSTTTLLLVLLWIILAVLIVILTIILYIKRRKAGSVNGVKDTERKTSVTEEYANNATTSQLRTRGQDVSSQEEDICYASVECSAWQPERKKTNSWNEKNVPGGKTPLTEDAEYGNIIRPNVLSLEEEVCYSSVQFKSKPPKNKSAVSSEESHDDAVIYSAVRKTASHR